MQEDNEAIKVKRRKQLTLTVTPLAGRLFGAWTAMAAVVRLLAAYDISNQG